MPFVKGTPKPPGSGRKAGTPNRISQAVRDQLMQLNCNPISVMAGILKNRKNEPALRLRAAAELARYLHPQLRSIELKTAPGSPLEIADVTQTRELLARRIAGIAARSGQAQDNQQPNGSTDTRG